MRFPPPFPFVISAAYGTANGDAVRDPKFRRAAERISKGGTRVAPYSGIPTFLAAPCNHLLETAPVFDLRLAGIGGVPFRSRFNLAATS